MFFRRKEPKKSSDEPKQSAREPKAKAASSDKRKHYRVKRSDAYPLVVSLESPATGKLVDGDCVDISLGGSQVLFDVDKEPRLKVGSDLELWVRSDSRQNAVRARAKVTRRESEGVSMVRYSFAFTNTPEIFAQLDSFYSRFFNRRRYVRVIPDLNSKVPLRISWKDNEIGAKAQDLSCGGVGILLSREKAAQLDGVTKVLVTLSLPGAPEPLKGLATVKGRATFAKNVLFGLEFDEDGGIDPAHPDLCRFVESRVAEIKRWNALMSVGRRNKT